VSRLRVLTVSDVSALALEGGAERVLWEATRRLASAGHAVRILSRAPAGVAPRRAQREGVDIVATPPQRWSIVPRPSDAVRVPLDWGDWYALCPTCRNRTPIKGHSATLRCPRCAGLFQIAWEETDHP